MRNVLTYIFLLGCSIYDIRSRKIPVWLLRVGIAGGALMAGYQVVRGEITWLEILLSLLPGIILLGYSRLTQGKLGEADGWMALAVGLLQQGELCTAELILGCLMTFAVSAVLLLTGKAGKSTRLPFAPFFLAAAVCLGMMGNGYG